MIKSESFITLPSGQDSSWPPSPPSLRRHRKGQRGWNVGRTVQPFLEAGRGFQEDFLGSFPYFRNLVSLPVKWGQ